MSLNMTLATTMLVTVTHLGPVSTVDVTHVTAAACAAAITRHAKTRKVTAWCIPPRTREGEPLNVQHF